MKRKRKMINIYFVVYSSSPIQCSISSEAYLTLEEAQRYIEKRSDNPRQLEPFKYISDNGFYFIFDANVFMNEEVEFYK